MTRIFLKESVLDRARKRVKTAFDDFPRIVCTFSGGKDSLVTLNLCLEEAKQRNRKVALAFLDQEAEWDSTITEIKRWMQHPLVIPYWCRVPFAMENSTGLLNDYSHYLITYDPKKQKDWIHPYDPLAFYTFPESITNWFKKMRRSHSDSGMEFVQGKKYPGFYLALDALNYYASGTEPTAVLGGLRASESYNRFKCCTRKEYKNINGTFGKPSPISNQTIMRFCPIYDWQGSDVWKYIYENNIPYNSLYDKMFQHGIAHRNMRVSCVCHEKSFAIISAVSVIEPDCWQRLQNRLNGSNTLCHSQYAYTCPDKFPSVFTSWSDYRDYLFYTLIPDDKKKVLEKVLARLNRYMGTEYEILAIKAQVSCILICDCTGVSIKKFIDNVKLI